jgi:ferric-dicitrate binding protein FerR (iron transport regulator)
MVSQRRIVLQPVALLLVFAVLQVFLVKPAKASAATSDTSTNTAPSSLRFGQLLTSENQTALVNGTNATSGTTIFSGAQLQTPDGVAATVQLGALGRLSLDPNTQLSLTFDKDYIDVQVTMGNALLTTNTGVKGTLTTSAGEKLATNANATSSVGKRRAAAKWFDDKDHLLGFIITAGIIAAALIVVAADDNGSSSTP